jgi:hypothetical protein
MILRPKRPQASMRIGELRIEEFKELEFEGSNQGTTDRSAVIQPVSSRPARLSDIPVQGRSQICHHDRLI